MAQIRYSVKDYHFGKKYIVEYIDKNITVASFDIYNYMGIPSMSISIEEEYQGRGITRIMMSELMRRLNWEANTILYIDTDASCGFWRHIGMKENKNDNGYELYISVGNLNKYIES
jgi:GNAT superfamily N-acetyltransferase